MRLVRPVDAVHPLNHRSITDPMLTHNPHLEAHAPFLVKAHRGAGEAHVRQALQVKPVHCVQQVADQRQTNRIGNRDLRGWGRAASTTQVVQVVV